MNRPTSQRKVRVPPLSDVVMTCYQAAQSHHGPTRDRAKAKIADWKSNPQLLCEADKKALADDDAGAFRRPFRKPVGPTFKGDLMNEAMRYAWHFKYQLQEQGLPRSWTVDTETGPQRVSINGEAARLTVEYLRTLKDEDGNLRFVRDDGKDLVHKETIYANLRNGRNKPRK